VFDQRWAIPDPALVADETYEWTVDGVQFALEVSGRSATRTRVPAGDPAVRLITTSAAFDSVLAGERPMRACTPAGDVGRPRTPGGGAGTRVATKQHCSARALPPATNAHSGPGRGVNPGCLWGSPPVHSGRETRGRLPPPPLPPRGAAARPALPSPPRPPAG